MLTLLLAVVIMMKKVTVVNQHKNCYKAYGMMPIQTIVPTLLSRKAIATLPTNPQQFTMLRSTNTLLILKTIR